MFYLIHPDTKKLMDVTFFVAVNDGSMLLSCKTTLMIGLITCSADHPKKTKSTLCVLKQEVSAQRPTHEVAKTEACNSQAGYKQRTDSV